MNPHGPKTKVSGPTRRAGIRLVIREADKTEWALKVRGTRVLIGRHPDAEVRLSSDRVSREHAELLLDESGRWEIRDLGSRNGTRVNGRKITRQPLATGDCIRIGRCELVFQDDLTQLPEPMTVVEDTLSDIQTLDAVQSPVVSLVALNRLLDLNDLLPAIPERRKRLARLCQVLVGPAGGGQAAMMLRVRLHCPSDPVEVVAEDLASGGLEAPHLYVSRSVLAAVLKARRAVLASNCPAKWNRPEITVGEDIERIAVIACPFTEGRPSQSGQQPQPPPGNPEKARCRIQVHVPRPAPFLHHQLGQTPAHPCGAETGRPQ